MEVTARPALDVWSFAVMALEMLCGFRLMDDARGVPPEVRDHPPHGPSYLASWLARNTHAGGNYVAAALPPEPVPHLHLLHAVCYKASCAHAAAVYQVNIMKR